MTGRYVVVQMDNGEGVWLNLREVMAFGERGKRPTGEQISCKSCSLLLLPYTLKRRHMSHLLLLGKFEYGGGPIFKVVLEC